MQVQDLSSPTEESDDDDGEGDIDEDPNGWDTDGDGMPEGWEIEHRRWIGDVYTGGNLWTLDPRDPSDAAADADGDLSLIHI